MSGQVYMNASGQSRAQWALRLATRLLEPPEREVVLGDLAEADTSPLDSLRQVLGLGLRRHASLWLQWRPWVAGPGLAVPASFLLMGVSLTVSDAFLSEHTAGNLAKLLTQMCLLLGWSWTSGFVVGRLSRRTLWASILLALLPCFDCLSKFHTDSFSPVCLLWFLIPAAVGLRQGLRDKGISLPMAIAIVVALLFAMIFAWQGGAFRWWVPPWWLVDAVMSWPAVYLVIEAKSRRALAAGVIASGAKTARLQ